MITWDKASLLHNLVYAETKICLFATSKFKTFPFLDKWMTTASLLVIAICPNALPMDLLSRYTTIELSSLCHLQSRANPHFLPLPLKPPNRSLNPIIVSFEHPLTEILRGSPWYVLSFTAMNNKLNLSTMGIFLGSCGWRTVTLNIHIQVFTCTSLSFVRI